MKVAHFVLRKGTHQAIGIHSFCRLIPVQKLEFRSGLLEWAETARIHFSGSAAGVGVMAHLQTEGVISLAIYRPKSKESSAFPKPYPLTNCAIGAEMKFGMNRIGWHRMQKTNTQERERLEYA